LFSNCFTLVKAFSLHEKDHPTIPGRVELPGLLPVCCENYCRLKNKTADLPGCREFSEVKAPNT
jgi:hypothetical protein